MTSTTSESPPVGSGEKSSAPTKPPRIALLIATGFGLGYLPIAPGTWGSLGGIAFVWLLWAPGVPSPFAHPRGIPLGLAEIDLNVLYLLVLAFVGVWSASVVAGYLGAKDPSRVVIDEVSGQSITLMGAGWFLGLTSDGGSALPLVVLVTPSWQYLLAGFILFRIFDIWKPWPARDAERLPGGWGIMADDWIAGVYAAICLWGLRLAGM